MNEINNKRSIQFIIIKNCTHVNFEMNDVKINLELYHNCIMLSLLIFKPNLYHVCILTLTFVIFENKKKAIKHFCYLQLYEYTCILHGRL